MTQAPCTDCRFDPSLFTEADVVGSLRMMPHWWHYLVEGADEQLVARLTPYAEVVHGLREHADPWLAVHDGWHAIALAARVRHAGQPGQKGLVAQVSASGGGVPKSAVARAEVTVRGLVGDRQADRDNHGRPWQALCLWSTEVIHGLRAEGHPIGSGCAGENITLRGLDWTRVLPGLRLRIGTAVVETTAYTIPCSKNARWFGDGEFRRIAHELHPGWSRIYARVVQPGSVETGDVAEVLPD